MNKLPCEVVRDLLPLYADELVSETTGEMIKEHIQGCEDCRDRLKSMKETVYAYDSDADGRKEIAFLKKTRKNYFRNLLICSLAVLLVFGGLLYQRYCVVGEYISGDWVACDVSVDGDTVIVDGTVTGTGDGVRHKVKEVQFEENNGMVYANTIGVRSIMPLGSEDKAFEASYEAEGEVKRVVLNDVIVWDEGVNISRLTAALYQTRHDYVGDPSMNAYTERVLNIGNYYGDLENDLTTDAEPYRWTVILKNELKESAAGSYAEAHMGSFAYAMLAVVGNLGEVEFRYTKDGVEQSRVFTKEEASEFLGMDIKDCANSPALLQQLLEKSGLLGFGFDLPGSSTVTQIDENAVASFSVHIATEDPIKELSVNCYVDGELRSSQGAVNADGSDLANGDIVDFSFVNRDLGDPDTLIGRSIVIEIDLVSAVSGKTYKVPDRYVIAPGQRNVHFFLYGSAAEGYTLY